MIDFNNKSLIKLSPYSNEKANNLIANLLAPGENVGFSFSSIRDKLIFTNKRIIAVNTQGITGKKVDFTSIPYNKIQTFSIETSGTFDIDSELDVTLSGLGTIRFELSATSDIKALCQYISTYSL